MPDTDRAVVVTVVHGRHEHLTAQRAHLARCDPPAAGHVVVAMDDDAIAGVLERSPELPTVLVAMPTTLAGLPVAAARNAGARAAFDGGATTVIFLDVDCLPSPSLVGDYVAALDRRPEAIVCGPVTYLPPDPEGGWTVASLTAARAPHPARPDPPREAFAPIGPALFWSLSFAVRAATWHRLGGSDASGAFHEGYVGYGGEDTDLGFTAAAAGVAILFVGGADAYHQFHPVSDPPVEHLDDILRNAEIFRRRHGVLPMVGWLSAFREAGLTETSGGVVRRRDATRLLTVPARHPYLDAALPPGVRRVDPDRVVAWEPDPLLVPQAAQDVDADVVHVHFGYEHVEPDRLRAWLDVLDRRGIPLVVTVHDLRNPHLADPSRHAEQLRLLVGSAARVITLSDAAAATCEELFGRPVDVVPHPSLLDDVPPAPSTRDTVLVPLKALRANVRDAARLTTVVADAATRTRVLLDPAAAEHPEFAAVLALGERPDVDVVVAGHVPHEQVVAAVAACRAVVLPYAFGSHSGWIELARDVGTAVIAPDCGFYASQWDAVLAYANDEEHGLDDKSLAAAVASAYLVDPPPPADRAVRLAQRDLVRADHEAIYRAVRG